MNGRLDDDVWSLAKRSERFVDMTTGEPGMFDTRVRLLYDDAALYIGFEIEDPFPCAALTERDSLIFQENDIEVFIDGGDCYYEFEMNALGTIYEVFFIWRDAFHKGSRFDIPEFDLYAPGVYSFGGDFDRQPAHFWKGTHPRGTRWALTNWDFPGLQSAVAVDGELNAKTPSKGWCAEIAMPWSGMRHLAHGRSLPPRPGDAWRMFFGRFQQLRVGGKEVQAAWCLTPHGVADTHQPEKFSLVEFA